MKKRKRRKTVCFLRTVKTKTAERINAQQPFVVLWHFIHDRSEIAYLQLDK